MISLLVGLAIVAFVVYCVFVAVVIWRGHKQHERMAAQVRRERLR